MTIQRYDVQHAPFCGGMRSWDNFWANRNLWRRPNMNADGSRVECVECGCWHPADAVKRVEDHGHVCPECLEALDSLLFKVCEECGAACLLESVYTAPDGSKLCSDCFYDACVTCECCEAVIWRDDANSVIDGYVCDCCRDDYYVECASCGDVILRDDARWDDYSEAYYCDDCYVDRSQIQSYGYKPSPVFHGVTADCLFMGVELEVDNGDRDGLAYDLRGMASDLFYLKHDSSLSDDGVEIVTHPCTLRYHLDSFPWARILEACKDNDMTSHDAGTCGLHIHVSREGLGTTTDERDLTAAKISLLLDRFWPQMTTFSRRRGSQLSEWACKPDADIKRGDDGKTAVYKSKRAADCTRYKALNLRNYSTVEFRLWRGTLNLDTLRATLAFTHGLVKYARKTALEDILTVSWHDMIGDAVFYVDGASAALSQYLTARGLTRE